MNRLQRFSTISAKLYALIFSLLMCAGAHAETTVTVESIDSVLFPYIYSNVAVSSDGVAITNLTAENFLVLEDGLEQKEEFKVTPPDITSGDRRADIVFLIDVSGSMGSEIVDVRNNVNAFATLLAESNVNYSLGLVRFGNGSGPNPEIFNNGNLTSDVLLFTTFVDSLQASGGYEPSFLALRQAALQFNFRPGAKKIFILITDEDSDDRNKASTIDLLKSNNVTVHAAVSCNAGSSSADYCDATSVRAETGGLLFGVSDAYGPILDAIAEATSNTYVIRYKTNNLVLDGIERLVEVVTTINNVSAIGGGTYIPGSAPVITFTDETKSLANSAWWAQGTPIAISAFIADTIEPGIDIARLYYRAEGDTNYQYLAMQQRGDGAWEATIPSVAVQPPGIEFYLTATDGISSTSEPSGAGANPINIPIWPNVAPSIQLIEPADPTLPRNANEAIPVSVSFYDETNNLSSVAIHYRAVGDLDYKSVMLETNAQIANLDAVIPASATAGTAVQFYISAIDDFGTESTIPFNGADEPYQITLSSGKKQQVLFIHGAMGSEINEVFGGILFDNELWPSIQDDDVLRLKVNPNGSDDGSTRRKYINENTSGIIKEHFGQNVYKKFIIDVVEEDDPDMSWSVFVYDWRLHFDDTMWINSAKEGSPRKLRSEMIVGALRNKLEELAKKDPDGKVDVVTHSLGGLLAKYYISRNSDDTLIRKFIIVDSPQLGTPAGAAVVMHGEHGLAEDLWDQLQHKTMREVTTHMVTSYLLTPNKGYFDAISQTDRNDIYKKNPVFYAKLPDNPCSLLGDGLKLHEFSRQYGAGVSNYLEWVSFFEDPGKIGETDYSKYIYPLTSKEDNDRKDRFHDGEKLYEDYIGENWSAGDVENVYQFVGENIDTLVGIEYRIDEFIGTKICSLDYKPITMPVGDGTVVRESQEALTIPAGDDTVVNESQKTLDLTTYYYDIAAYNAGIKKNRDHATVLEIDWVQKQITRLLRGEDYQGTEFTSLEPINRKVQWSKWSIKSPVDIHVYDSVGNHTGPILQGSEELVPNSSYYKVGTHKYVTLPVGYDELVVEFRGIDTGTFSLSIENYDHTDLIKTIDYLDIPVTPSYRGRVVFNQFSDISSIESDNDGDGIYEDSISPVSKVMAVTHGANYRDKKHHVVAILDAKANSITSTFSGSGIIKITDQSNGNTNVTVSKIKLENFQEMKIESSKQVSFNGPCTLNKVQGYDCTIGLFDGDHPGVQEDYLSIKITGPDDYTYITSGIISGGDISLDIH